MRHGVEYLLATEILVPVYNSQFLLSAFDGEFNLHQNSESCVTRFSSNDLSAATIQPADKYTNFGTRQVPFFLSLNRGDLILLTFEKPGFDVTPWVSPPFSAY